jgi:hypothetical protein
MLFLQNASAWLGLFGYVVLIIALWRNPKLEQSFVSYLLWCALDTVLAIATYLEHGNYILQAGYALGAGIAGLFLLLRSNKYKYNATDIWTLVLVLVCIFIWSFVGNEQGIIASCAAMFIAAWPQIKHTFKEPEKTPASVWAIWNLANFLSFIAGNGWTIKERLFPGVALFVSIVVSSILLIKKKK